MLVARQVQQIQLARMIRSRRERDAVPLSVYACAYGEYAEKSTETEWESCDAASGKNATSDASVRSVAGAAASPVAALTGVIGVDPPGGPHTPPPPEPMPAGAKKKAKGASTILNRTAMTNPLASNAAMSPLTSF